MKKKINCEAFVYVKMIKNYKHKQSRQVCFQIYWKKIILSILKDDMPFKMHKIIFFPKKNEFAYPT